VGDLGRNSVWLRRFRWLPLAVCAAGAVALVEWLRSLTFSADPDLRVYLVLVGTLLCFTYAANALVRFRGTSDRMPLVLAFGFAVAGLIEVVGTFSFYGSLASDQATQARVPLAWMVSRTTLGLLFLAALVLERRGGRGRDSTREAIAALVLVGSVAYLTSAVYLMAPVAPPIRSSAIFSRPWDLLPAAIFLLATIGFRRRLRVASTAFDHALYWAAALNVACHLVASQSERLLDAPHTFAHVLKVSSYAVVLGGALLDNARLFDEVRNLAVRDPLTGLSNYRHLLDVLESEVQRSLRTGRPFAVLLLDLDGLKTINDRYGHLVGSRALCRLANILRVHCRAMDTAARYGGDEFAVVLPETTREAAEQVAQRIRKRLAADAELPVVSVSMGTAVFPQDGDTIEKLLSAADRALYRMKGHSSVLSFSRLAVCL